MGSLVAAATSDHALILLDQTMNDTEAKSLVPVSLGALHRLKQAPQYVRGYARAIVNDTQFDKQSAILVDMTVVDDLYFPA